ncbi:MAG TPA: hypothetical protein VMW76_02970 [Bacteroidales bacterium]|nr:hypothetical protein [Bacteroidales bacterium]
MKKVNVIVLTGFLISLLFSCGGSGNRVANFNFPESDSIPINEAEKLSQEAIEDIVQNISSPVEMASLLQALEVPFFTEYLASTREADGLSTNFQKALQLGVYGADLGYLNIYEKTGTAIDNLATINKLADALRVGQFFDFETLKRLAVNKTNIDSLLFMSVHSFNEIDEYLRENNRGYLSSLMITGVWIEAQYLACMVLKDFPHRELKDRIGEQKIVINDLLLLLRPYMNSDDEFSDLYSDLERIKTSFRPVEITYIPGDPETIERNGRLVVIQNETSVIMIDDDDLSDVIKITEEIRNKVIANQ